MKNVISVDTILDDLGESFYPMHEYPDQPIYTDQNKVAIKDASKALHSLLISKLPEKREETWLNKDLVEKELEWALKALPVSRDMGFNSAIDDVKAVLDELFRSGDES